MQPDGHWKWYVYVPREYGGPYWVDADTNEKVTVLKAAVGPDNILFKEGYIVIDNYGDERGDIFGDLYADSARILYKSAPCDPNWGISMPDYDKYWDMPEGGVTFTLKAGHDTTVDETVTAPVEPAVPRVEIAFWPLLPGLAPLLFVSAVVAASETLKASRTAY